ncbi:hypothetical protein GAO09_19330 [Rhizobiales bacterium RZME27]|uniref:Uncharacterized protein n=1 Tax=Endobacterium cereale TaxID=2663029 RepID=A0A6A8AHC4_9HYPH|nr:hypothetical protein [Endobacterium cereale]MQY48191.1 hypothetical protein [Endobacterium cereale]
MPRVNAPIFSLNGGEVGEEALARLDLERMQFAGALYSNMLPKVIGSMSLRPGLEHIADIDFGPVQLLEYAYSGGATLLPILSNLEMRVVKDRAVVARQAVATTVVNGEFGSFAGWSEASGSGASASVSAGDLVLAGTLQNRAAARQTISVASGDQEKEHALRVDIERGPVDVRIGTSAGRGDLVEALGIEDGVHSLSFTPFASTIYIELANTAARQSRVESCQFEAAGPMVIPTPWDAADLSSNLVKYRQKTDVIYASSTAYQQREIQRRGDTSWGMQRYKVGDGPFSLYDGNIQLQNSVSEGNGTITASQPYFEAGMVGRLFRLFHNGALVTDTFNTGGQEGARVRISGVGEARRIGYQVSGTFSGIVTLQSANDDGSGNPTGWVDVVNVTAPINTTYKDSDDNVIKFFRFTVKAGNYTSGSIVTTIAYSGGSQSGICRITAVNSPTNASMEVLKRFLNTTATSDWDYSTWSDYDGWPSAVERFGGRLYWGKGDIAYGSVPDAFKSFDDTIEGASAPIARSVGAGSQRGILWLLGLERLFAGSDVSEISIKASSFDEPLTPDAWFPVDVSTLGCSDIRPVKADKDGIFIQSSGVSVYRMAQDQGGNYGASNLMAMHEEICDGSPIVDITVQRRPDTTVWFVLTNGEARALTYEPSENVVAWSRFVTDGQITNVAAVRGKGQDSVYFAVIRNGKKRLERLADAKDCRGGALNCLADGFTTFTATANQTVFSVPQLAGKQVTVWVNGKAVHDQNNLATATGGNVTLTTPVPAGQTVVIGLPYIGRWQSTKLAYGAGGGTALFMRKKIAQLGLYLTNTVLDGLRAGRDFATLRQLTSTKNGGPLPKGQLQEAFDFDLLPISSDWNTDSRVCLEQRAPYPFTASAMVLDATTNG